MIRADFHTHSRYSGDSKEKPERMIKRAVELGLHTLCFTDHMDYEYPYPPEGYFEFDPQLYFSELSELKRKYSDKLKVLIGVELGLRNEPELLETVKKRCDSLVNAHQWDFVIGSTHLMEHVDPAYPEYWESHTIRESMEMYFQADLDNAKNYNCYDCYGHIDYLIRYAPEQNQSKGYSCADYRDLIEELLKTLISAGKGIEINTKGLKPQYGIFSTNPKQEIVTRYRELGGELITVGSDAHCTGDLAGHFTAAEEVLKKAGFDYYTVFEGRKPGFKKFY